ncbi:MAG: flagellar filament capping protein FliD, partial [Chitinophagaceae bacterium]|nr:flagellar filament capping protein FliD [Rubrivivax sp.]
TAGAAPPITVPVTATDTLQTLRDKINSADSGVTATLVTDASGVRLSLRSTATGAENGFRASVADDDVQPTDASGLSRFAFDPENGQSQMLFKQAALNAEATVNGIDVVSASNELTGAIEGLTLRLRKTTTTPGQVPPGAVDVAVTTDREALTKAVQDFADAYNGLANFIRDQTKFDATSKVGGLLQGDSAVGSLQARLRNVLNTPSGASAKFPRLSDLGLELQRDGTLSVDSAKLNSALADLPELQKAFTNKDALVPDNNGFARRYALLASQVLAVDGSIMTRTEGLQKLIAKNADNQDRLEDRVTRFEARLIQQYTAMDANLSKLNALQSYVTQQLAALSKQSDS